MGLGILAATLALMGVQTPENTITYKDGIFTLTGAEGAVKVSTLPGLVPMNTSTGRLWLPVNGKVVTFDSKGLGIRANNRASHTTFPSVPTSSKLVTKDQADEINREVANETRSLDVSALSGWELVGNKVYLLLRWDTKTDKKPWMEVLVELDMGVKTPTTRAIGMFKGFSTAQGRVNDRLVSLQGKLAVATVENNTLGIALFDPSNETFTYQETASAPTNLLDAKLVQNSRYGMTFSKTAAGKILVGTFSTEEPGHRLAAEIEGPIVDAFQPCVLVHLRQNQKIVTDLLTGTELAVPRDCGLQPTNKGLLLWTPTQKPTSAALYTFGAFRTLARWPSK